MLLKPAITVPENESDDKFFQIFLLYTGAFLFSIIATILIHELGHFLAFQWRGYTDATLRMNPFMGATSTQQEVQPKDMKFIVLGGTIFNLSIAAITAVLLRFTKSPYWLPARMYPATAFLIEGMVIIAGLFFKATITDFAWMISLGWNPGAVGILGTLFIIAGGYLTYEIWVLMGIDQKNSHWRLLILNIPYILYCLAGFLIGQAIAIDLDFFKKFLATCAVLHLLYLGIRIMLYPAIAPLMQRNKVKTLPRITIRSSIFSFALGCTLWVVSIF